MFVSKLPEALQTKRRKTGKRLYQKDVAKATGVHEKTISRWMQGEELSTIDSATLVPLMLYLGCTFEELVEIRLQDAGGNQVPIAIPQSS